MLKPISDPVQLQAVCLRFFGYAVTSNLRAAQILSRGFLDLPRAHLRGLGVMAPGKSGAEAAPIAMPAKRPAPKRPAPRQPSKSVMAKAKPAKTPVPKAASASAQEAATVTPARKVAPKSAATPTASLAKSSAPKTKAKTGSETRIKRRPSKPPAMPAKPKKSST